MLVNLCSGRTGRNLKSQRKRSVVLWQTVIESLHRGLLSGLRDKQCFEFFCRLKQRLWGWKTAKEFCRASMTYGRHVFSQDFYLSLMPCTCHMAWSMHYSLSLSMTKPGLEEISTQIYLFLPGKLWFVWEIKELGQKFSHHVCEDMWSMYVVTSLLKIIRSTDHGIIQVPVHREWLFIQDFCVVAHCSTFLDGECLKILSKLLVSMSFA